MIINILYVLAFILLINWIISMQILNLTSDSTRVKRISVSIAIVASAVLGALIFIAP